MRRESSAAPFGGLAAGWSAWRRKTPMFDGTNSTCRDLIDIGVRLGTARRKLETCLSAVSAVRLSPAVPFARATGDVA